MKQIFAFIGGFIVGLTALTLSMGSVDIETPNTQEITDDTALYQEMSEIRTKRTRDRNFEGDVNRLSLMEGGYQERLPLPEDRPVRTYQVSRNTAPQQRVQKRRVQKKSSRPHRVKRARVIRVRTSR